MRYRIFYAISLTLGLLSPQLLAQPSGGILCAARAHMIDRLANGLGESVRSVGLARENHLVEIHASDETGSWSITVTNARGTTCLVASGLYFEALTPTPAGAPT